MDDKLKNCPSCGGTLNDDGRCPYCNSKVYDLSDINIDMNSNDTIKLKVRCGNKSIVMDCYPRNISWTAECPTWDCGRLEDGTMHVLRGAPTYRIGLELVSFSGGIT